MTKKEFKHFETMKNLTKRSAELLERESLEDKKLGVALLKYVAKAL